MKPFKMNRSDYKGITEFQQKYIDLIIKEDLVIVVANGGETYRAEDPMLCTKEGKVLEKLPRSTGRAIFKKGIVEEIKDNKEEGDYSSYQISKEYFYFQSK